ncbi:disease resistance RPP13-like protein 4 [Panicum virgatum]|uniref:disease resistance RPP13-like protein 4 n=1 Tax=Panicum virgatum TaxID=38727 RepID=UPI0019D63EDA|nr:disease resistance RPP13-like protein 4 [Panicum virgatum]
MLKKCGELPIVKATDLVKKKPELVEEANKILKKCGGLPLAIVTIGGYLASRPKTRDEWRKIDSFINAELEMNLELGTIRTILEKSYVGLPYHLKSCFLYLSIFPEDHIISRRRLVRRWITEGYSSERRGMSAIEMAENNFTELKNRSMILPFQLRVRSRRSIDSCRVHDLIRDIAISKSMEECPSFLLSHFQSQQAGITVGEFSGEARFARLLGWNILASRKPAEPQAVRQSGNVAGMDQ